MTTRQLASQLRSLIKLEQKKLREIENSLKSEKLDLKNIRLLIKLDKAAGQRRKIEALTKEVQKITQDLGTRIRVGITSKVYLLSSKVNKLVLVDAKNYIELVGKTIGDAVTMNNSTFLVAGIY